MKVTLWLIYSLRQTLTMNVTLYLIYSLRQTLI